MKKLLFCCLIVMYLISCNEPNAKMRDYEKAPALIEHCLTLSDDEIIDYLQGKGYSLLWCENDSTPEEPHHCFMAFFPSEVFQQYSQRGEELADAYRESGEFYFGLFFETANSLVNGNIVFTGDLEKQLKLYKSYSQWAYKNLKEFSNYQWQGSLAKDYFIEGSFFEDTYEYGGYSEYMQALDSASAENLRSTFNYAVGPNNTSTGVICPDYEISFENQNECYYSRIYWGERKK